MAETISPEINQIPSMGSSKQSENKCSEKISLMEDQLLDDEEIHHTELARH